MNLVSNTKRRTDYAATSVSSPRASISTDDDRGVPNIELASTAGVQARNVSSSRAEDLVVLHEPSGSGGHKLATVLPSLPPHKEDPTGVRTPAADSEASGGSSASAVHYRKKSTML